jgi:hypothetical protein
MEIDMIDPLDYIRARSALTDAASSAHLCYWVPEQNLSYHDGAMREALALAAKHLGYTLAPITQEAAKNILPADEING